MRSGANRLGVPPPKKMLASGRPCASGRSWSRSRSSASTYSSCGSALRRVVRIEIAVRTFAHAPRNVDVERQRRQLGGHATSLARVHEQVAHMRQRLAAMTDAILDRGIEFGGAAAEQRIEKHRVVAEAAARRAAPARMRPCQRPSAISGAGSSACAQQHDRRSRNAPCAAASGTSRSAAAAWRCSPRASPCAPA